MARGHLLNYYEDGDFYDWHDDSTVFTVLNWFCQEPQAFTGGEFGLRNQAGQEKIIEFKNNRVLIIPSCTTHKVYPISLPNNPRDYSGLGRYSLTVFVSTWPSEDHPGRRKK
jgi:Rps23 Pro-64 3,4-dihydroxylase Tpa1-like proline 4-hydroxylase